MEIQWSLLLFSLIAGTGGSLLVFNALSELFGYAKRSRMIIIVIAAALVVVGGTCSIFHLEQKRNLMAAATNIFSFSPISLELIMVGLTTFLCIVYFVCLLKEVDARACKVVAVLSILSGLALGFVTGDGYRMGAQPLWNTITLPLAYLGTDLAAGGALYLAVITGLKDTADVGRRPLALSVAMFVVSLAICLAYGLTVGFSLAPMLFWVGVMGATVIGLACAVVLLLKGVSLPVSVAAVVFGLCAGGCLRAFMWVLGTGTLDLFTAAAEHAVL